MGKDLTEALARLTEQAAGQTTRRDRQLPPPAAPAPIPPRQGAGISRAQSGRGGSGGNLTETAYQDRTYYPYKTVTSSDGLFSMRIEPLKTLTFTDVSGGQTTMSFARPPEE